jgi:hypothetical protein
VADSERGRFTWWWCRGRPGEVVGALGRGVGGLADVRMLVHRRSAPAGHSRLVLVGLDPIGQVLNASSMARSDRHRGSIPRTLPLAGSDLGTDSRGRIPPQLPRSSRPGLAPSRLIHRQARRHQCPR